MTARTDAATYTTAHTYADSTTSVVITVSRPEGMVTVVTDGPLHDHTEVNAIDRSPEALRNQHHKWVWRVLNADRTHPEFFQRKARRLQAMAT